MELFGFVGTVLASICTYQLNEAGLRAQLETEQAQGAVQGLLSVLCDVVILLDGSGQVLKPTPQLRHLHQRPNEEVQGTRRVDHLASEDDERRFEEAVGSAAHEDTSPTVLHVHMKRSSRPPLPVEIFHASILDPDGQWGHLLGIRDVGNDHLDMNANAHTPAIDESLLAVAPTHISPTLVRKRGARSSSSHTSSCADVEIPNLDLMRLVINADGDVIRYVIQFKKHQCAPNILRLCTS